MATTVLLTREDLGLRFPELVVLDAMIHLLLHHRGAMDSADVRALEILRHRYYNLQAEKEVRLASHGG